MRTLAASINRGTPEAPYGFTNRRFRPIPTSIALGETLGRFCVNKERAKRLGTALNRP